LPIKQKKVKHLAWLLKPPWSNPDHSFLQRHTSKHVDFSLVGFPYTSKHTMPILTFLPLFSHPIHGVNQVLFTWAEARSSLLGWILVPRTKVTPETGEKLLARWTIPFLTLSHPLLLVKWSPDHFLLLLNLILFSLWLACCWCPDVFLPAYLLSCFLFSVLTFTGNSPDQGLLLLLPSVLSLWTCIIPWWLAHTI
jgi:hypothetical protein